jgi:trehalose 6-phosphate synthase/phosphatase
MAGDDDERLSEAGPDQVRRLVVVSNRLPVVLSKNSGDWESEQGSGGLVTAIAPVLRNRGGLWIGWPGTADEAGVSAALERATRDAGYSLIPVPLSRREVEQHYRGFSNEVIWPLFHDLQTRCNFDPEYWDTYQAANRKFAEVTASNTTPTDFVWVHDYHLMLAAQYLRELGARARLGFFLHIPFPPLDIFLKLPWRRQILEALLAYDLLGFQTMRDRRNFVQCLRTLVPGTHGRGRGQVCQVEIEGKGPPGMPGEGPRIGAFPISIDFGQFEGEAASHEVAQSAWHIHENLPERQIVLGVDRMDYTKGIPARLRAFRYLLEKYPEHRDSVTLVQVVVPSRRGIPGYESLKVEIERLVGAINGELTGPSGRVPIHYIYRSLDRIELLGYYRASEIALVTPLKDGMNLVAKEYCACNLEESGVLILSEFAGAVAELQNGALLVNPNDIVGVAAALHQALTMQPAERHRRMHLLRQTVRRHDIFRWVDSYLRASIEKDLNSFPILEDYVPGARRVR